MSGRVGVRYDREEDEVILSTGRSFYAHGGVLGLPLIGRGGVLGISYGSDGGVEDEALTRAERRVIARAMIAQWRRWARQGRPSGLWWWRRWP